MVAEDWRDGLVGTLCSLGQDNQRLSGRQRAQAYKLGACSRVAGERPLFLVTWVSR
jgi:hypothetical protein